MTYLMSPNLYNQLIWVSGFVELNGNNYGEHILKVFLQRENKREEERENEKECADKIKKLCEDEDAVSRDDFPTNCLALLKAHNIKYTHQH